MNGKIVLGLGTPDESNRDYLPEVIYGSDIVVNENGNNSRPLPQGLVKKQETLVNDEPDVWYEYVPETYDPSKKTPLVISFHGGLMTGWGQCIYTSWSYLADREGFIAVFPDAHTRRFWTVEGMRRAAMAPDGKPMPQAPESISDIHDIKALFALIEYLKKTYNIDEERVYVQGMSMGGLMTSQVVRHFSGKFAGFATAGAPNSSGLKYDDNGNLVFSSDPIPAFISMPEHNGWDINPERAQDQKSDVRNVIKYWSYFNGCHTLPQISIRGEDNYFFYKGDKADIVLRDIKNRDHGQTLDDAELVWDYLFSGTRRNGDGTITQVETVSPRKGDRFGIALAIGLDKALVNSEPVKLGAAVVLHQKLKYHGLNGGEIVRGEYFCAPVSFLADALGAECLMSDGGKSAEMVLKDGRHVSFALGSVCCVVDNKLQSMDCEAIMNGNELCVPVEWLCNMLLNLRVTRCDNVLYITDHYAELSTYAAMLITDILSETK